MVLNEKGTSGNTLVKSTDGKAALPIKQVLRDALTFLGRDVASKLAPMFADITTDAYLYKRFRYYFTVPTIWSDDAKVPARTACCDLLRPPPLL